MSILRVENLLILLSVACGLLFSGCGGESSVKFDDNLSGEVGQVLVLTESPIKGTPFADSVKALLGEEYPYLPQAEPRFESIFIPVKNFTGVFKSFRNVLVIDIQKDSSTCSILSADDQWAKGQAVVQVVGPSFGAVWQHIRKNENLLKLTFEQVERQRLVAGYRRVRHEGLSNLVARRMGLAMDIPPTMKLRVDTTDFLWISLETPDISQGVLCYRYPYRGALYSVDTLVKQRNGFTQRFVPGPTQGTYMQVADFIPPELKRLRIGGDTLMCVRGLWEVHGHPMGGAFLAYSRLNASGDSVVVAEGYIYAPKFEKRNYVRELEAILLSRVVE